MVNAGHIMKTSVLSVGPEDTLDVVLDLFIKNGINGAPVVGDNQDLIGIITERDIVNFTSQAHVISQYDSSGWVSPYTEVKGTVKIKEGFELIYSTKVKKVMTEKVCSVTSETSVQKVAFIMNKKRINHIPVVDNEKLVIGIITRSHLIRHMAMHGII